MGRRRSSLALYDQEYVKKDFERLDLFRQLATEWGIRSALYPGSFVHVTPSFVIPVTIYADTDARARRFFCDPALRAFLLERKEYDIEPQVTFLPVDYMKLKTRFKAVDLLVSQYAGFVSKGCSPFLKLNGLLLANDSHGDASLAKLDPQFELVAVVQRRSGRHSISIKNLDQYFIAKRPGSVTAEEIEKRGRGIGYKQAATAYLFRKVCVA